MALPKTIPFDLPATIPFDTAQSTYGVAPGQFNPQSSFMDAMANSFGNQQEQNQTQYGMPGTINPAVLGSYVGKIPGMVGTVGGGLLGTAMQGGEPLGPASIGLAGAGNAAGETAREALGKFLFGKQQGTTLADLGVNDLSAFLTGAAAQTLGGGLQYLMKAGSESIADSTVGPTTQKEIQKDVLDKVDQQLSKVDPTLFKYGAPGQTTGQAYLENNPLRTAPSILTPDGMPDPTGTHTAEGLMKIARSNQIYTGRGMDAVLSVGDNSERTIDANDIKGLFDNVIDKVKNAIPNSPLATTLTNLRDTYLSKVGPDDTMGIDDAVKLYRDIYDTLPEKVWSSADPNVPAQKEILKNVAGYLSSKVKEEVPAMADLNSKYGFWSDVLDNVSTRVAKLQQPLSWGNLIQQGIGRTIGSYPVKTTAITLLDKLAAPSGIAMTLGSQQLLGNAENQQ